MLQTIPKRTDIFWTGGWDSTFRIIQLLMTTDNVVQPHFIIRDEGSTGIEINAMNNIRRLISREYASIFHRFLPTIYANALLIEKDEGIADEIEELIRDGKIIDPQYILMANYCREFNINEIELGLEVYPGESQQEFLDMHFGEATAFKCFRYPIFHLTKEDMLQIAKQNDWVKILSLTSFCRKPLIKANACGICGPCIDTVVAGLDFRLPYGSRIKARIQKPFRVFWRNHYYKNQNNWFFKFVKSRLENTFL